MHPFEAHFVGIPFALSRALSHPTHTSLMLSAGGSTSSAFNTVKHSLAHICYTDCPVEQSGRYLMCPRPAILGTSLQPRSQDSTVGNLFYFIFYFGSISTYCNAQKRSNKSRTNKGRDYKGFEVVLEKVRVGKGTMNKMLIVGDKHKFSRRQLSEAIRKESRKSKSLLTSN